MSYMFPEFLFLFRMHIYFLFYCGITRFDEECFYINIYPDASVLINLQHIESNSHFINNYASYKKLDATNVIIHILYYITFL